MPSISAIRKVSQIVSKRSARASGVAASSGEKFILFDTNNISPIIRSSVSNNHLRFLSIQEKEPSEIATALNILHVGLQAC